MSADFFSMLGWLPTPPIDFRARARGWGSATDPIAELQQLARYALNFDQLNTLARQLKKANAIKDSGGLTHFRLGIVSNNTADHIAPALLATGLRHGLMIDIVIAPYGQLVQAATGGVPEICDQSLDAVLCATDARAFPANPGLYSDPDQGDSARAAMGFLQHISDGIANYSGAPCILQTLAPEPEQIFGSLDREVPGTGQQFIQRFNSELAAYTASGRHLLFDVAQIAATVGVAAWHDPKLYLLAKMPFAQQFVALYAEHLCRLLAALKGKSRRCLVLDLDNTLWGGVIGDDRVAGLLLGQGDPVGEAFLSIQETVLKLRQRGVVLAVSSKNDDAIAREPFRQHPDMLLKEEHIAVFRANWDNKADNIVRISQELGLGLDTFVFLDDNPVERDLVRRQLPEVAVPELPDDPALYARALLAAGYFESVHYSPEDRVRADDYQARTQRQELEKSAVDMDAFLKTLGMLATITPFQPDSLKRVTQLVNKSNQFNLTTRRYSESAIEGFSKDAGFRTWQVRLADTFGDNGLISVVICSVDKTQWEIDTWLMSCRVLGRRLEELVLREIVADARIEGVAKIGAIYIPTERNGMVTGHYEALGFTQTPGYADDPAGSIRWELSLKNYVAGELPFSVSRT